jgi:hypothetical protein
MVILTYHTQEIPMNEETESVSRLSRDVVAAAATLSADEARFLVDCYYSMQEGRIRAGNQVRALSDSEEPCDVLIWLQDQSAILERQIGRALDRYSAANPVGAWSREVLGIGPILAAGLLAHIDINRAPTVGHIWRFAGLDPTSVWAKGKKRPWNASLKTLCWKIGESFVKVSGREGAFYGHIYSQRKLLEQSRNEAGEFKDQAELKAAKVGKTTDAYKSYSVGKLPPAHIHARAKRYAVKLFLAHWHEQAYRLVLNKEAPMPYVIEHLGHVHKIDAV